MSLRVWAFSFPLVAELIGTLAEMIAGVYSHMSEKKSLLIAVVNHIRPS